jgi:magnesium chelatase subunit I
LWLFAGLSFGRKYYGGIGLVGKKGRPQFHVAVASVATDIGSVQEVRFPSLLSLLSI